MRIIIALHRSRSELLQHFRNHFAATSKYDVVARFSPVRIKTEIRRDPNDIAALIVDAAFMHLAEEPQITDLYQGPIIGVYVGREEKAAMESIGLTIALDTQLIAVVEQALKQRRRRQKPRIVACLARREPDRDMYFKVLSNIPRHELVRCVNAKQALDTVVSKAGRAALLVVGYDARLIVPRAYRAGYTGGVLAVSNNPDKQDQLSEYGLFVAGPGNFRSMVAQILRR